MDISMLGYVATAVTLLVVGIAIGVSLFAILWNSDARYWQLSTWAIWFTVAIVGFISLTQGFDMISEMQAVALSNQE